MKSKKHLWSALILLFAIELQAKEIQGLASSQSPVMPLAPAIVANIPKLEPPKALLSFEPIIGITFSNFTGGADAYKFEARTGYQGGLNFLIGRGNFQFETGLLYSERGAKEIYQSGVSHWEIDYHNRYLEVPTLIRYSYQLSKDAKIFLKGGAVIAVLQDSSGPLSNTQYYTAVDPYYGVYYNPAGTAINDGNTKNYFASTDIRWAAGLGGSVKITKAISWSMQADYQTSITKVSNNQPNGYIGTTNLNLFAVTYGLNTGIVFSL